MAAIAVINFVVFEIIFIKLVPDFDKNPNLPRTNILPVDLTKNGTNGKLLA
ncbi:MAG: hypothetical protein ACRYFB_15310 [Janthinobacterium lividum]